MANSIDTTGKVIEDIIASALLSVLERSSWEKLAAML